MDFISFEPLIWLVVLLPLLIGFLLSLVERRRVVKWLSFIFRAIGVVLLILALCRPFLSDEREDSAVVFVLDISESIDLRDAKETIYRIEEEISSLGPDDSWSLYYFGRKAEKIKPKELRKMLAAWMDGVTNDQLRSQTNIADALLQARMSFPSDKAKRMILISDGRATGNGLVRALEVLKEEDVDLQRFDLKGLDAPEASVISVVCNAPKAYYGEKVRMTAKVASNTEMGAHVRFLNRGIEEGKMAVKLVKGINKVECDIVMTTPGSSVWTVELLPDRDHYPVNNKASCTIDVKGKAKVLALHKQPRKLRSFKRALAKQDIEIDDRGVHGLPETLSGLLEFDAIILADIPATDLSSRQMMHIKQYVIEFGGGLLMMGSENSFGLGGYYRTPVEEVLPIVSRYEKEKEKPSLAMCLVIDKSGSMSGEKIRMAREAAKATVQLMSPRDRIAVVAFDGEARVVVDMMSAGNSDQILGAIDSLTAGGGTNMYPAMAEGQQLLEASISKIKHMIILGDGQSSSGDFEGITAQMSNSHITVSTVALGDGADQALMAAIADVGKGRYYETMDASMVPRIFTRETMEASRSAIKEEPFTPIKVGDANLLDGIDFDNAPFLLGYVMTKMKPTAQIQLLTENHDPLLAVAQFGLGKSVAFASDATENWAGEWLQWKSFGTFWAQVLRTCIRKNDSEGMVITEEEVGDRVRYQVRCKAADGFPACGIRWKAKYVGSDGQELVPEIRESGYGLYEVSVPKPSSGSFTLRLHDVDNDKVKVLHFHQDYPVEYQLGTEVDEVFAQIKGCELKGDVTKGLEAVSAKVPVSHLLMMLAIFFLLGGLVLRRVYS